MWVNLAWCSARACIDRAMGDGYRRAKRWADGQEPLLDGDAGVALSRQASESRFPERGWPN